MMMRYALVNTTTNVISNIIIKEPDYEMTVPDGMYLESVEDHPLVQIGWVKVDNEWRRPQPYPSWSWNGEDWVAPIPYPAEGTYTWAEDDQEWIAS